jgi:hypothetical protein
VLGFLEVLYVGLRGCEEGIGSLEGGRDEVQERRVRMTRGSSLLECLEAETLSCALGRSII